jgi:colicin import membrane protein
MPVDLISASEFSQMMAGAQNAPKAEKPQPFVDKVGDPKPVPDPTPKVSNKPPIEATAAEPPPPPPPAPPEPEVKETKPAEPQVDPIAEALHKEEQRVEEQKKLDEQKKVEEQKKREEAKKRAEAKKIEEAKKREDAKKLEEKIAALLDKREARREAATGAVPDQTPALGSDKGHAPTISQTELDALRARLRAVWKPPMISSNPEQYVLVVRIQLGRDRMLTAPPQVVTTGNGPLFQAIAESAKRAVLQAQPFDMLSLTTYDTWSEMELTFDPRDLDRG